MKKWRILRISNSATDQHEFIHLYLWLLSLIFPIIFGWQITAYQ